MLAFCLGVILHSRHLDILVFGYSRQFLSWTKLCMVFMSFVLMGFSSIVLMRLLFFFFFILSLADPRLLLAALSSRCFFFGRGCCFSWPLSSSSSPSSSFALGWSFVVAFLGFLPRLRGTFLPGIKKITIVYFLPEPKSKKLCVVKKRDHVWFHQWVYKQKNEKERPRDFFRWQFLCFLCHTTNPCRRLCHFCRCLVIWQGSS